MNLTKWMIVLALGVAVLAGCDGAGSGGDSFPIAPVNPQAKGDRLFGINMSEGTQGFDGAYADLKAAGAQVIELNIPWNAFYVGGATSGGLQDPWEGILAATALYGSDGIKLALSIAVIDTAGPALPSDIASSDYDSPTVMNAFKAFVDELFDDLGDDPLAIPASVDLVSISIGNEVNYTLGDDAGAWDKYLAFVESAAAHIKIKGYAGVIGCKTTVTDGVFAGQLAQIKTLNALSDIDVVMLNYYPKDSGNRVLDPSIASTHLSQLVSDFASVGKDIWMMELGYQSGSTYCNSSETKQGQFFWHFFQAWDSHRNVIKTVIIDWLNDQPQWQIDQWAIDYGSSDPAFLEYLATLGLRNPNGSAKHGWTQVSAEISARGW